MNQVVIKSSYYTKQMAITINNEPISPYSSLSAICNKSFEESVSKLIKGLDDEIYDDYEIAFYSTEFQYQLLKSFQTESEFCQNIYRFDIESLLGTEEILKALTSVGDKYELEIVSDKEKTVYADEGITIPSAAEIKKISEGQSDLGIFRTNRDFNTSALSVLISNMYGVKYIQNKYVLLIPETGLEIFWEYFINYECRIPRINEYLTALKYKKLADQDKIILESIRSGKANYYLGAVPSLMDKDDSITVEFCSFPENAYSMKSSNSSTLKITGNSIIAVSAGNDAVEVWDNKNNIIETHPITVIEHQYVENINLIPRFSYLKKNERNHIDMVIEPANGEDFQILEWKSSNPSVVQVDEKGNVIALQEGKAFISVSGRQAHSSTEIEVKAELKGLYFDVQKITLRGGQTYIITCVTDPLNAAVENLRWELDNRTIATFNPSKDGRKCQIIGATSYQGSGNIRCFDPDSRLSAVCPIEVTNTKPKGHGCLITILTIVIFFIIIKFFFG